MASLPRSLQADIAAVSVLVLLSGCAVARPTTTSAGSAAGVHPPAGVQDSGIRGRVLLGPTCPVASAGDPCVRPYEAAISIRREPAGTLVARLRSSPTGVFTVTLAPGRYLLTGSSGHFYPRTAPRTIVVSEHRYVSVTIFFDTGIRGATGPPD